MVNYERPAFDSETAERLAKPRKGAAALERKENRKAVEAAEESEKRKVRARDQRCRWPHCEHCRRFKGLRLDCAHVVRAKGMGGDHGTVSTAADMMLLDQFTHADQEQHRRDVRPLTVEGTAGPCEFWAEDDNGKLYLVARELAPFRYERD